MLKFFVYYYLGTKKKKFTSTSQSLIMIAFIGFNIERKYNIIEWKKIIMIYSENIICFLYYVNG